MSKTAKMILVLCACVITMAGCDAGDDAPGLAGDTPNIGTAHLISCAAGCTIPATPPYGAPESGSTVWQVQTSQIAWSGGAWDVVIPVNAGDVVSSVSVVVRDNPGDAGNYVSLVLLAATPASIHQIGNVASDRSGATQTITMTPTTPHIVEANETLYVQAIPLAPNPQYHIALVPSTIGAVTVTGSGSPPRLLATGTLSIHGSAFQAANFIGYNSAGAGLLSTATGVAPIPLSIGSTIAGVRAFVTDTADGPTQCRVSLVSVTGSGMVSTVATSPLSSGTGTTQMISALVPATTVAAGTFYALTIAAVGGTQRCSIFGAEVDLQ